VSIILDALRKAEEERKLQQSSSRIDITRQILNNDKRASQGSSAPVNKAVLAGVAIAITGLAALGIYSSLTALRKEKPVRQASTAPVAAPSPTVVKTKPAPEDTRVAPPPAPTVAAAPSAPPKTKTAPAPSAAAAARTPAPRVAAHSAPPKAKTASAPSEIAHKGQTGKAAQNSKVAEKTTSNAVFGPPDVDTQHQVIPNEGDSLALEGIIFHADPDKRLAIMRIGANGNEATVRIGDTLGSWLVGDIQLDKVTFSDHAKTVVLKLE
jgi:hypothetical protein